jgi:hypothetical protein
VTRYKLRVPQTGDVLYGDGIAIVADTLDEAREAWEFEDGEPAIYLHSYIGRCHIVYARDVEDAHEDAEPGDTTVDYCPDDGRELRDGECRVWMRGAPDWSWDFDYSPPEPVCITTVPVGVPVYHQVLGSGRTVGHARKGRYGWRIPIRFGWPDLAGPTRLMMLGQVILNATPAWPGDTRRVTVTVAGEVVAAGVRERTAELLRDLRCARLRAEWEAEQFAAYDAARAAMGRTAAS